ncbi:type II toxin-antitoxin system RelB/DinJ family antitoxin [Murimonas intestini]|uniref:Addiction module RelB/DinJ family antitoxin n=1 Tax=Murimonas intestini TaxID=1337051 RepID=A0AB73T627_9FIRM|nr:type II toxin-antitoxin system RelB/DinJ family antitoxin [Murimonas intestini]MCR1841914.1 type II toxin-antitoxin system RelB/DinJ family antitoxin [Murimonas intestini]MCR1864984.1 type II toxin-antitoxin system RelB/DinJ family antitoxin [Murimonas intestini]MCR1885681.1 type II toxin-antitoxin system RelB/DinJ family antitoxin [Murimonas intestini]
MAKSASVYARIDPVLKEQAESILSALGIPTSNAIDMFFKQIVLKKGLPFEVRLPYEKPVCMGELTEEELNAELEKGYADLLAGRTKPIEQTIAEMRKDFKI